jgi:hypothetical protein
MSERVRGEDVEATVAHERRHGGHCVEHALDGWPNPLRRTTTRSSGRVRCAREIEEVSSLGVLELECTRERLEHAPRRRSRCRVRGACSSRR